MAKKLNKVKHIYAPGGSMGTTPDISSMISGMSSLGSFIDYGIKNAQLADTSGIEGNIAAHSAYMIDANTNDELINAWSNYNPLKKVSYNDVRGLSPMQRFGNNLSAGVSGATTGASVGGPYGALAGGILGTLSSTIGSIVGDVKAWNKTKKLNKQIKDTNSKNLMMFDNKIDTLDNQNDFNIFANYSAYGGKLNNDFTNGIIQINNGDTHEENPYEGVQLGMDSRGIPNLVEEGEVIFKDYVFSNRLKPDKDIMKTNKYKGDSYAKIAKNLQKESEERPNDPISKRGLEVAMNRLMKFQELDKLSENINNLFAEGGTLTRRYAPHENNFTIPNNNIVPSLNEDVRTSLRKSTRKESDYNNSWLRYAPVVGSGISALVDMFTPIDYSNADLIGNSVRNLSTVEFNPIGTYLSYKPIDRNYYTNKLGAQAAATRRAIIDQSNGNRATAMANLINADYNNINQLGDLAIKAEEYNNAQKERVAGFNRQTDMFNSEGLMKAAIFNKQNEQLRLKAALAEAQMRYLLESGKSALLSSNLTNLFDNLGNVGIDEANRADLYKSIESGALRGAYSKGGKLKKKKGLTF